ncbi:hypothetical protein [Methylosinus sp. Sm6]|uniref:hypothetical protein n=1 Tax=Methylosinus sp. Sm6 TaxID=2866948 RepID=UPI001C994D8E|nr:hypothetical protein [Methylosinus sp. Sm6]MBY6239771.1 hypothetical protein [Methylosinus sp. Sm6]
MRDIRSSFAGRQAEALPSALAGVVIALQAWLVLAHVAWRDEAQAYLLATQPRLSDLFASLHYEGHPALWHLLLRGAALIAPSLVALKLVQLPIALATDWIIWFRAPFGPWLRLSLLTSYFLLFEYGVIARSYGLGALLLFAFLALRASGWRWAILALMANVSLHLMLLSGVLVATPFLGDRRETWPRIDARFIAGFALWTAACVAALATMWPAPDARPAVSPLPEALMNLMMALHWASASVLPGLRLWGIGLAAPASLWLGAAAAVLGAAALASRPRHAAIWLGFYGVILSLSTLVYPAYGRHVGLWTLLLVALLWIAAEDHGEKPGLVARAWIAALSLAGLIFSAGALTAPFSGGDMAAQWLISNRLDRRMIAAYPGWNGIDLSARLDAPYFNLQTGRVAKFETWNYRAEPREDSRALAALAREAAKTLGGELLIYSEADSDSLRAIGATPLVEFPRTQNGERKAFYKLAIRDGAS